MTVAEVSGVPAPTLHIPYPAAITMARLAEMWAQLTGGTTLLTVNGIRSLSHLYNLSSRKAMGALGFTRRPLAATLRDEVQWFRQAGLVAA